MMAIWVLMAYRVLRVYRVEMVNESVSFLFFTIDQFRHDKFIN